MFSKEVPDGASAPRVDFLYAPNREILVTDFHLFSFADGDDPIHAALPSTQFFFAMDDYSLGPLDDERKRETFWRDVAPGYQEENPQESATGMFAPWRELQSRLLQMPAGRVYVWHDANAAGYVFLRMACHWLAQTGHALFAIEIVEEGRVLPATATLEQLCAGAAPISPAQRREWAEEFAAISARPEMLRELDETGHLQCREMHVHDDFMLACSPVQWQPAARVVGETMAKACPPHYMGDVFWNMRLQYLIDAGLIEADGERVGLRNYRVRRRQPVPGN
jgi:hypothetical protein